MTDSTKIPPSVAEYSVMELSGNYHKDCNALLARIAELEAEIERQDDAYALLSLDAGRKMGELEADLKLPSAGVVMPERSNERGSDGELTYEAKAHNRCLDEFTRLNASRDVPSADAMADRFISWPLPDSVRPDSCAMNPEYPHRYGTNLLTWAQAKAMFEYALAAPSSSADDAKMVRVPREAFESLDAAVRSVDLVSGPSMSLAEADMLHDLRLDVMRKARALLNGGRS